MQEENSLSHGGSEIVECSLAANGADSLGKRLRRMLLVAQAVIYAVISYLSIRFEYHAEFPQRPILLVLGLLATLFVLHIISLRLILRTVDYSATWRHVFLGGVLFRLLLLPSYPIQEVDIYRYLWDGTVVASGYNPYRFSPQQMLNSMPLTGSAVDLKTLLELKDREHTYQEILTRIHFGELITVYPPVSQAVFGLAELLVPTQATVYGHLLIMKTVLTGFDLASFWLVLLLLSRMRRHPGWAILYGWSPLVLKEFANSGHLDSIAVFLTTAAILVLISGLAALRTKLRVTWLLSSAILLGLGVGAKLYPIVLVPVLTVWVGRTVGRRLSIGYGTIAMLTSTAALTPMLITQPASTRSIPLPQVTTDETANIQSVDNSTETAGSGLVTFLSRWEINDWIFMVVVENLRPDRDQTITHNGAPRSHWFVVLPHEIRARLSKQLGMLWQQPESAATFLTARAFTALLFVVIVIFLLTWGIQRNDPVSWLRVSFLTLAWFWALAPTLNPWYWTWVLPLIPFCGRRSWIMVSLLVLAYYIRFWLLYHSAEIVVLGSDYRGQEFFHYVIVPIEHLLWLTALSIELFFSRSVSDLTEVESSARV